MARLHSSSAAAYPEPEAAKYLFGRDGSSCTGTPFTTVALSTKQTVITSLITTETVVQVPTTVTIPHSVCISEAYCFHYAMIFIINIVLGGYFSAVLDIDYRGLLLFPSSGWSDPALLVPDIPRPAFASVVLNVIEPFLRFKGLKSGNEVPR
jgi:hypothetical protein